MLREENEDAPKQVEETKSLDEHPDERPLEEDEQDSTEETYRASDFLFASEE